MPGIVGRNADAHSTSPRPASASARLVGGLAGGVGRRVVAEPQQHRPPAQVVHARLGDRRALRERDRSHQQRLADARASRPPLGEPRLEVAPVDAVGPLHDLHGEAGEYGWSRASSGGTPSSSRPTAQPKL